MEYRGPLAYDEKDFLETYLKRRSRPDSPNNAIEGPILTALLGDIKGMAILDLGSGDGGYGKELLLNGAQKYTAVEGSPAMMALASENLAGLNAELHLTAMENFRFAENSSDIVISRMAMHYIENLDKLLSSIKSALKKDGKFIFSVQHPLTTSSFKSKSAGERKGDWIVDDYFQQGRRDEPWMGKTIIKYHRTIETYFTLLSKAGFLVEALQEGEPVEENFTSSEEYERRKRIPVVLVFSCRKE